MTTSTPHLALPLIAAAQAQKHVTHNEALYALDALVHLAVLDRHRTSPPVGSAEGDRHIVAAGASGAWAGKDGRIAAWQDAAWRFYAPRRGWLAYVLDDGALLAWEGSAWADALAIIAEALTPSRIGLATAADAANPFSAKLNDALWAAKSVSEGGSGHLRSRFSKEGPAGVLSLLFQTGFSGRAELGLVGDDDFRIKVSPDGAAWSDALRIDRTTGAVSFPSGAATPAGLRNRIVNGNFAVNQRGHGSGVALTAGAFGHDRWKAGGGGCAYAFVQAKPDTTITITAGTLVQVVEDVHVEGGAYALSWSGSAQARLGAGGAAPSGAYASGPIVMAAAPPGQILTVEFGAGTLGKVQLEPGATATPFERRPLTIELALCQRYYCTRNLSLQSASSGSFMLAPYHFPVEMRVVPSCVNLVPGTLSNATVSTDFGAGTSAGGCIQIAPTAAGGFVSGRVNAYSAEV